MHPHMPPQHHPHAMQQSHLHMHHHMQPHYHHPGQLQQHRAAMQEEEGMLYQKGPPWDPSMKGGQPSPRADMETGLEDGSGSEAMGSAESGIDQGYDMSTGVNCRQSSA